MLVRPMLGGWEPRGIEAITTEEARRLVRLPVPGLAGDLHQDLGRSMLALRISGSLAGDDARDEHLKELRTRFKDGAPVDFVADIINESELEQVLISDFRLEERAGDPDGFRYEIVLVEYTEPPEPPSPGSRSRPRRSWARHRPWARPARPCRAARQRSRHRRRARSGPGGRGRTERGPRRRRFAAGADAASVRLGHAARRRSQRTSRYRRPGRHAARRARHGGRQSRRHRPAARSRRARQRRRRRFRDLARRDRRGPRTGVGRGDAVARPYPRASKTRCPRSRPRSRCSNRPPRPI